MKLIRAAALAGLLALSGAVPANAQDAAAQQGWVEWGSGIAVEVLDAVAYPFQKVWTMAWDAIGSAEAEIAAEKTKFATKLKSDLAVFSKDVNRTGFAITTISISPDIIPKISLTLEVREPVSEAVEAELRTEFENKERFGAIERIILLGLLDLDETAADLKVDGYRFSEVDLDLVAIFPEVTLNFESEQPTDAAPATAPAAPETLGN